jgi:stage V sporulation protein AE
VGVFLSAVGIYKPLVDFAGCGATVPLTGFGHNLAKGVKEAVDAKGLLGVLSGGLSSAAAGLAAVILFGYIFAIIFNSHPKK